MAAKAGLRTITCKLTLPLALGKDGSIATGLCEALEAALAAEAGNISLVLMDHITSPTGIRMPVARLAAIARAHGARVLCDGAHAPAQIAGLDVPSLGVDWYVGNLHKWAFTLKGVALLWSSNVVQADTQGSVISHFWKMDYQARHFMQGTLDYARYLSAAAGAEFVDTHLGGFEAMRASNIALAEAGARILEESWWSGSKDTVKSLRILPPSAYSEGLCVPFLAVVRSPFDWRAWVRCADGKDARKLDLESALAALEADGGVPERCANAVLAQTGRVQSVFFPWEYGGEIAIWCRISAQVYNVVEDYEKLARAVAAVKLIEGTD